MNIALIAKQTRAPEKGVVEMVNFFVGTARKRTWHRFDALD